MNQHQAIETGIDRLATLIHNHQEISLTHAAKMLNVSRPMIEHWAETLEESGEIATRQTLGDMVLTTPHMSSCSSMKQRIFEQILSMRSSIDSQDMRAIKKEQNTLRGQLKELEAKSKELKKLSKNLSEVKSREKEVKHREAACKKREQEVKKHEKKIILAEAKVSDREQVVKQTVEKFFLQRRALAARERELQGRESAVASREHSLEKSVAQIQSITGH